MKELWVLKYALIVTYLLVFLVHQHNGSSSVCKGIVRSKVRPALRIIYCLVR